jgi:hypothetical protein
MLFIGDKIVLRETSLDVMATDPLSAKNSRKALIRQGFFFACMFCAAKSTCSGARVLTRICDNIVTVKSGANLTFLSPDLYGC